MSIFKTSLFLFLITFFTFNLFANENLGTSENKYKDIKRKLLFSLSDRSEDRFGYSLINDLEDEELAIFLYDDTYKEYATVEMKNELLRVVSYSGSSEDVNKAKIIIDSMKKEDIAEYRLQWYKKGLESNKRSYLEYINNTFLITTLVVDAQEKQYRVIYKDKDKSIYMQKVAKDNKQIWIKKLTNIKNLNTLTKIGKLFLIDNKLYLVRNSFEDLKQYIKIDIYDLDAKLLDTKRILGSYIYSYEFNKNIFIRSSLGLANIFKKNSEIKYRKFKFSPKTKNFSIDDTRVNKKIEIINEKLGRKNVFQIKYSNDKETAIIDEVYQFPFSLTPQYLVAFSEFKKGLFVDYLQSTDDYSKRAFIANNKTKIMDTFIKGKYIYMSLLDESSSYVKKLNYKTFAEEGSFYLPLGRFDSNYITDFVADKNGFEVSGVIKDKKSLYLRYDNNISLLETKNFDEKSHNSNIDIVIANDIIVADAKEVYKHTNKEFKYLVNIDKKSKYEKIFEETSNKVEKVKDGYLVALVKKDTQNPSLGLLQKDGQMIISREYEFSFYDGSVYDMKELSDGTYLVVGDLYRPYKNYKSFIMIVDKELNPIWSKVYKEYARLDNIHLLSDGNYLLRYRGINKSGLMKFFIKNKTTKTLSTHEDVVFKDMAIDEDGFVVATGWLYKSVVVRGDKQRQHLPIMLCYKKDLSAFVMNVAGELKDELLGVEYASKRFYTLLKTKTKTSADSNIEILQIDKETCKLKGFN